MSRRAAFLDRDDTIIRDTYFVSDPAKVELLPGAASAIKQLNDAGIPVVVVTNQSGLSRGLITPEQYESVKKRLDDLLAAQGAHIDATYVCPHYPSITGLCECRKPGLKLFKDAARDLDLDLKTSVYIGDKVRDVEPGKVLGGVAIRIVDADDPDPEPAGIRAWVRSLADAVTLYLNDIRNA